MKEIIKQKENRKYKKERKLERRKENKYYMVEERK
jgi:hypothetical protein